MPPRSSPGADRGEPPLDARRVLGAVHPHLAPRSRGRTRRSRGRSGRRRRRGPAWNAGVDAGAPLRAEARTCRPEASRAASAGIQPSAIARSSRRRDTPSTCTMTSRRRARGRRRSGRGRRAAEQAAHREPRRVGERARVAPQPPRRSCPTGDPVASPLEARARRDCRARRSAALARLELGEEPLEPRSSGATSKPGRAGAVHDREAEQEQRDVLASGCSPGWSTRKCSSRPSAAARSRKQTAAGRPSSGPVPAVTGGKAMPGSASAISTPDVEQDGEVRAARRAVVPLLDGRDARRVERERLAREHVEQRGGRGVVEDAPRARRGRSARGGRAARRGRTSAGHVTPSGGRPADLDDGDVDRAAGPLHERPCRPRACRAARARAAPRR